ncbi:MAG: homoserine O-acetyltransferase [Bacteroidales bacterium]|nr:homoserine O-acetyltransferase [Bacteroidales bacterium]MCL2739112.1 homoserine O-acetyltransferase [Bacteroidales bacterium]
MYLHSYHSKEPFILENGQRLSEPTIAYHTSAPKYNGQKVLWICHALTANSDPTAWWEVMTGPGKCFDPLEYFIVCANILGSCYGSTGPMSLNPNTGAPYYDQFPVVSVRDWVAAHNRLRIHLGIKEIDTVIGASVGGFQALEYAICHRDVCKRLVLIASNARVSPWNTAFNESQRMAILADPTYQEYRPEGGERGLAAARSIALLSYRSNEGYLLSQEELNTDTFMAQKAASYQQYQGEKLRKRFDAYSYMALTKTFDTHNAGRGRGGLEKALQSINAQTLCIGITGDRLFPPCEVKFMARHIPEAQYASIDSDFGHDGFLLEWKSLTKIITAFNQPPQYANS